MSISDPVLEAERPITEEGVSIAFGEREVLYDPGELDQVQLAYAATVHKLQGSQATAVVMPLTTQHFAMLQRNLVYTGITRGAKLVVMVGQKKALAMAVRNVSKVKRVTRLARVLRGGAADGVRGSRQRA